MYECIGYVNCSKSTFSHQGKKKGVSTLHFHLQVSSVWQNIKKIESANCGQANVTVTEIKTEIKRGDCNTVKPADLPFLWLWVENIKVSHAKVICYCFFEFRLVCSKC